MYSFQPVTYAGGGIGQVPQRLHTKRAGGLINEVKAAGHFLGYLPARIMWCIDRKHHSVPARNVRCVRNRLILVVHHGNLPVHTP